VHYGAASDRSGRTGAARRGDGANGNAASGLDDVIKPSAISGTFQLTSTSSNEVLSFSASKLNPNDYYTSVASLGGFGQINPHTGVFTLLVPAAGAHGLTSRPGRRRRFCVLRARIGGRPSAPRRRVLGWNFRTSRRPGCRPARQPVTPAADHQAQATKFFG